jgi:hypothetical protein
MRALWFLVLVGCGATAPAHDAGPLPNADAAADLGGETCDQINHDIDAWLAAHHACSSDGDCQRFDTVCTQPTRDYCNRSYASTVKGAYYNSLLEEWLQRCAVTCLDCPPQMGNAACNAGVCGYH